MSFLILQSLRCDVGRYFAEIVHNLKSNIRSLRDVSNELQGRSRVVFKVEQTLEKMQVALTIVDFRELREMTNFTVNG